MNTNQDLWFLYNVVRFDYILCLYSLWILIQPAAPYSSSVTSVRGNASFSTLAPAKQQKVSIKHEPDIIWTYTKCNCRLDLRTYLRKWHVPFQPSVITNRTRAVPLETLETGKTPSVSPVGSEQSAKKQVLKQSPLTTSCKHTTVQTMYFHLLP